MRKNSFEKIPPAIWYRLINHGPVVLITSGNKKKTNIAPVAWNVPVNDEPPTVAIVLDADNFTASLIRKTREFVINVPDRSLHAATKFAGSISGRDEDKFAKLQLPLAAGRDIRTPHLADAVGYIECKVARTLETGGARVVIARVLGSYVQPRYWKNNRLSPRAKTFHHLGGGLFAETGVQFQ